MLNTRRCRRACAGDAAVSNLEQHLASLIPAAAGASGGSGSPEGPQNTLSAAMQRRIHHNIQLAARCARLEAQKQALESEKAALNTKLEKAQVTVPSACLGHLYGW